MDSDRSHTAAMTGSTHSLRDRSHSRHRRSSVREQSGSEKEESHTSRTSSTARSDANSETSRYNKTRGPVNEAVQSAFKPTDPNHPAISPEILSQITSQITASVLEQLKKGTDKQADTASSIHGSPPLDRGQVYTPPSPYRASEEAARRMSMSPKKHKKLPSPPNTRRPISPPFSHGTLSDDNDTRDAGPKRPNLERVPTGGDATIVEKVWGKLFNEETGTVTPRLSQFLRGIAVHLIEDYEPKHSLVVSPEKMQKYYEETRIASEIYPWQVIFDDRTSSISRMFREVEAQHHLTQDRLNERPDIPGLTPQGFETWMTLVLKAHPDEEFQRLAYTALHMPVSNPDDRKERFAKEVSRRQFPKESDDAAASKLRSIVATHCGVKVTRRCSVVPDQEVKSSQTLPKSNGAEPAYDQGSHAPRAAPTDYSLSQTSTRSDLPSASEHERLNLRPTVSDIVIESDDHPILPKPIERERQPYSALPGGGKNYNQSEAQAQSEDKGSHSAPPPASKLGRSASLSGRTSDTKSRPLSISIHQKANQSTSQPVDIPPPLRNRANSTHHREGVRGDRNRSPSISRSTDYPVKSESESQYGSYHSAGSTDYTAGSWRPDKNTSDRYDRGSFSGDQRDREARPRYQSVGDEQRYYHSGDGHHRASNASYAGSDSGYSSQQYPPNSYRGRT